MKKTYVIPVVSIALLLISITPAYNGIAGNQSENMKRAQESAKAFMGELQAVLMKELRTGGPVQALSVCADTAQALTMTAADELGVSIKRISDRVRNPGNAPDEYEQKILNKFSTMHREGEEPPFIYAEERTIEGKNEFWYIQSIHLQAQCLGCHGEEDRLAENVRKMLLEKYPGDRATGYAPGDFRGAIRVSFSINNH